MPTPLKAVLLDVDGTLVDSNDAHARAWVAALAEAGFDVPFSRIRSLIGKGGDHLLPEVTGLEADSDRGKAISERRGEIFKSQHLPGLKPFPGARDLLEKLRAAGLTLIVATSAEPEEMKPMLELVGADDLVDDETSADDAEQSKPDPDIIHAALKQADCAPDEALMLGDTPYDVEAARKAGVGTVALRSGGWSADDLSGAIAVYDDAADLLARFDGSPFAPKP